MKLKPLDQYIDFIEAVQTCAADVYFCSEEGDRLNLKSTLSQFLFASICGDRDYLRGGTVRCQNSTDYDRLSSYLVESEDERRTENEG
ncbi:hypothetical protein ACTQ1O_07950 [Bilifractor sp. LCP21S3_A7]|uniref:hypothetical protein n=1 Tax=Bilifractor sp. LCP21S3_A7 TaxID=3438738 RepID=UPI003F902579